jgi:alanine-glyoxylate transaminase/serine-glyoxylate transaminase/serine-pyruvate transaminase
MPERRILAIPGPTIFDPYVLRGMGIANVGHLSREFTKVFGMVLKNLRRLVYAGEESQTFVLAGSGTLAMEASVVNLIEKGDSILVVSNGFFGWSMRDILMKYEVDVDVLSIDKPGDVVDNKLIIDMLREKSYKLVTVTHVDTSTGVRHNIRELAEYVRDTDTLLVVDGVCSVAGEEIRFDEWGIDVLFTGSQKAIGVPVGLGIIWYSRRALERLEVTGSKTAPYYMDLGKWRRVMCSYEEGNPIYYATPPVNLIYALSKSLEIIFEEGLENRFRRHLYLASAIREGLRSIGLTVMAKDEYAASTITSVYLPDGISLDNFKNEMARRNVIVAGGIYPGIRDKYFRIGHMGIMDYNDGAAILASIERSLLSLGYELSLGSSLTKYQEYLMKKMV